jgi:lysozyme family protein
MSIDTRIQTVIDHVIEVEGGYVNHPSDPGGATMYGITAAVARANGYTGPMQALPRALAFQIYYNRYVVEPKFDTIMQMSAPIAAEMIDSGVNAGVQRAAEWLQEALNLSNRQGEDWPDIPVDGKIGPNTRATLAKFLAKRSPALMVKLLDARQGKHYWELAEKNAKFEDFIPGWFNARIGNVT